MKTRSSHLSPCQVWTRPQSHKSGVCNYCRKEMMKENLMAWAHNASINPLSEDQEEHAKATLALFEELEGLKKERENYKILYENAEEQHQEWKKELGTEYAIVCHFKNEKDRMRAVVDAAREASQKIQAQKDCWPIEVDILRDALKDLDEKDVNP